MKRASLYCFEDVVQKYAGRTALAVDSLRIEEGGVLGLVGPNGSGKSTLIRILAFLERPTQGRVTFYDGQCESITAQRRSTSLLLQESYLLRRSVYENVAYGLKVRNEKDIAQKVHEALRWVCLDPAGYASRDWKELSGGEAQRVAMAARLVLKPRVLLLDEPTLNLDDVSAWHVQQAALRAGQEWGTSVIIVSHDLPWLFQVADRIITLDHGKVIGAGMMNVLAGPWVSNSQGQMTKTFSDGQVVVVNGYFPATQNCCLDPRQISIIFSSEAKQHGMNTIQGRVSQNIVFNKANRRFVGVRVGETQLWVEIDPAKQEARVLPGEEAILSFSLTSLTPL